MKRRLLILHRPDVPATRIQLEPLRRYLRRHRPRGLEVEWIGARLELSDGEMLARRLSADVVSVWFQLDWRQPSDQALLTVQHLRAAMKPGMTLVALDAFDDTTTGRFELLDHVDLYVKKQIPADPMAWPPTLRGGMIVSDYTVQHVGGEAKPVDSGHRRLADHEAKLFIGPNIAAGDYVRDLLRGRRLDQRLRSRLTGRAAGVPSLQVRPIDVLCRLSLGNVGPGDWYHAHRMRCLEALRPVSERYRTVAGAAGVDGFAPVSRRRFTAEMFEARICVSPFGYGELCYRDFEAMACGCLLIKPDVSHVRTRPDLLVAGETYTPVKWDFSDLAAAVERCLADPAGSEAIARAARRRLVAFHERGLAEEMQRLLEAARIT